MGFGELVEQGVEMARKAMGYGRPDDPKDLASRIAFLERTYQQGASALQPLHRLWYEDLLWMIGEHYMEFDPRLGRFINRPDRGYVPRATSNLILDAVERAASYLVKSLVRGHAVPEDASTRAYRESLNADRVNDRLWKDDRMGLKVRIAATWAVATGNGMFLSGLDAVNKRVIEVPRTRKEMLTHPETGEVLEQDVPEVGEDGEPAVDRIALSDVCSEAINPMEVILDLHARNPWEVRYFVHHRLEDIDSLVDQFGAEARKVKPDRDTTLSQFFQHKLADIVARSTAGGTGFYGLGSASEDLKVENAAVVKTLYRLPCSAYPEGEMLVVAGGEVLVDDAYPWRDSEGNALLCLHHLRWHVSPGSPWGFGMVRNLRDPQRRINGMFTQGGLARKTMGNPSWLAAKGSGFDAEGTSRPGKVYLWSPKGANRAFPPQRLEGKGLSADFWREFEITERHFDRSSGMNDILRGENPTGVTAGVSLELLSERATGRFGPAVDEAKEVMRELQEFRLGLVQLSPAWMLGKKLLIRDEDGAPETLELRALDVPKNPRIEMDSVPAPLWSAAAKRASAERSAALGLVDLTLPANRRKMRDLMGASDFEDPMTPDVRLAEVENQRLMKGEGVSTREFENAEIHLTIHRRLLLRPDYEELDARVRERIEDHYRATVEKVKEIAEARLAASEPPDLPPRPPEAGPGEGEGNPEETPAGEEVSA